MRVIFFKSGCLPAVWGGRERSESLTRVDSTQTGEQRSSKHQEIPQSRGEWEGVLDGWWVLC